MQLWNQPHKQKEQPSPYDSALQELSQLPAPTLALAAFSVGALSMWGSGVFYRRFFRRIPNGDWITPDMYRRRAWIKGKVVSVGDADNFRVYHTPGFGWNWLWRVPTAAKALKDNTIHIRIAGVDAPEGAHFGRPMQPNYEESLAWLKHAVAGRTVYCQVLRRDQYSRVVAMPYLKPRILPGWLVKGKCLPIEMLRAGWVVTYDQGGAEYGPFTKEHLLAIQKEAERYKRGIWKDGPLKETPAEYKKRYSGETVEKEAPLAKESAIPTTRKKGLRGLLSRLGKLLSK